MQISFDIGTLIAVLAGVIVNVAIIAFSYGKFSARLFYNEKRFDERMAEVNQKLEDIADNLKESSGLFCSIKDSNRIELRLDAAWDSIDHIKEQMIPSLQDVITKTLKEHQMNCSGYKSK